MDWNNNIAGELPAPRDDEPPHLREDILAELTDHLACAMNRELHATGDEQHAKKNVIEKFGNPASIARRLWWDAMKERIMSQRILIGTTVLMAIACIGSVGIAWTIAENSHETNLAIMEKLSTLSAPAPAAELVSLEWNPVKVRLVKGQEGGPPAEGFQVTLTGNLLGESGGGNFGGIVRSSEKSSDSEGIVDFGLVRPGQYQLQVTTPFEFSNTRTILVQPGSREVHEIICPEKKMEMHEIRISVDWPEDLEKEQIWLICDIATAPKIIDDHRWFAPMQYLPLVHGNKNSGSGLGLDSGGNGGHQIAISPSGKLYELEVDGQIISSPYRELTHHEDQLFLHGLEDSEGRQLVPVSHVEWWGEEFQLMAMTVAPISHDKKQRFFISPVSFNTDWTILPRLGGAGDGIIDPTSTENLLPAQKFRVDTNQNNHWVIKPEERMLKYVRESVKRVHKSLSERKQNAS